jgi:hypothetical protein
MARKPNYQFERMERQRAKASKKAMRLEAKRKKAEESKVDDDGLELPDGDSAEDAPRLSQDDDDQD